MLGFMLLGFACALGPFLIASWLMFRDLDEKNRVVTGQAHRMLRLEREHDEDVATITAQGKKLRDMDRRSRLQDKIVECLKVECEQAETAHRDKITEVLSMLTSAGNRLDSTWDFVRGMLPGDDEQPAADDVAPDDCVSEECPC